MSSVVKFNNRSILHWSYYSILIVLNYTIANFIINIILAIFPRCFIAETVLNTKSYNYVSPILDIVL